ncbi:hypothetical protein HF086_017591 [Spodoptera exigua]|uniref:FERM domain-containing protein n=1 Tax=Spodoptera exigua TaxID=7107 RepID=A0A922MJU7_SPOEX|nr:hypothetical protein HF086_017591 [Spodoptera exigua]
MPSLSLNIVLDEGAVTRKVKFNTNMTVKQALAVVKDKVIVPDKRMEYALFLRSADNDLAGVWLEDNRTLDYYMLRDGDALDYICKIRTLRVKLLDDTVKTLQVDEAKTVGELMMGICARIGITNYDEYGLCHDEEEETEEAKEVKEGTGTLTLKKKQAKQERDAALEQLSKKLKTDDNVQWLDLHRSLREQGIDPKETLLLKRRLYYSDRNVDSRDPVQLHLLYVQTRDTILKGTHPVTEQEAIKFAGIQCQVQLGDYQEKKHKTGFIENFEEYLPAQYLNAWNIEKKIVKEFSQHQGLSELEAKFLYIKAARALPTYGVTFFLVKEKQKDKKKLVPRLLGINSHAILRLDEVTKEILQEWPLTHVKTYHAGKSQTFTLNFGDYSDKEYSVKTQDCHRIRDILEGYIDIIRRRMLAKPSRDPGESMAICHDNVQQGTSHLIQHVSNNPSKVVTETFVGPNKLMTSEHGSQPQSGTMITTVQQLVVTDHLQNQQMALKGEMPLRGDMSKDCIRKLNNMNSNSVKIVGLLTDPTDHDYEEIQKIVRAMKEDFPDVDKGVKETADKQAIEDAKKMLLEELHDLNNFMNKLDAATTRGHFDREGAKDAAENIADLTTQVYFSLDPKTRRRSELIRRSRNKMKAGEKSEQSMRRASFLAAANSAQHALDSAVHTLHEDYTGPKPDAAQRMNLEKSLEDKMGKLNAAIALYLTAHSDPENIDYASAINSMNAINELMPEIAKDTQILASTLEPSSREQLLDDMQELCDATRAVCGTTSAEDHARMQEATNQYAGIAGKLISTFARGSNADKEHELTAPAIHEPHCQSALTAACEGISSSVHQLETAWRPLLEDQTRQPMSDQLHSRVVDVAKALERLKDAYANLGGVDDDDSSLPAQERKRLKFIATMNGAKGRLQGVEDLWNQQSATGVPSDLEKAEAQRRMEQSMAQLNAAIAALAAATADRENPDYVTAELAIATISELMPQIVKDALSSAACGLLGRADWLAAGWQLQAHEQPELQPHCALLTDTHQLLADSLHRLADACNPMKCQMMEEGAATSLGEKLNERIAQLNAAVAALAAATADREHPDYEAAEKAVDTISQIMPHLIQDSQKLCGTKSDAEQAAMLQELRALCETTQELCDNAGQPQILGLSTDACGKASELLSQVQQLTERVADAGAAAELDRCGASAADAAQALLTVAQATASTIDSPHCKDQLISAAQKLRVCADELTASCEPHTAQLPDARRQLGTSHRQLADCLDKLMKACQRIPEEWRITTSKREAATQIHEQLDWSQESTLRLRTAAKTGNTALFLPLFTVSDCATIPFKSKSNGKISSSGNMCLIFVKEYEGECRPRLIRKLYLSQMLMFLDPKNSDWIAAEQAVKEISELMPLIVQEQAAMLDELKALCHASRTLCENCETDPKISTKEFHKTASKLKFIVSPTADKAKAKQVEEFGKTACKQAERLALNAQTACPAQAPLASRLQEAADTLGSVVQATSSSPSDPSCSAAVHSSADNVRRCAQQLTSSCEPAHSCCPVPLAPVPEQQKQQRLKFINSASGAKGRLNAAEQLLKEPLVCQLMKEDAGAALQRRLGARVAQLNAAVAGLTAATADREHPDYAAADQAIQQIAQLMPQVVQESRTLCGTKSDAEQAAMLQELRALCEATQELCEHAGQAQGVSDAAAKFSAASGKLVYVVSPKAQDAHEKQVMALAATSCGKASELLSQVQQLTERVADAGAAAELDRCGASAADAAQALLTVAQMTAPTISDPQCQKQLISAAQKLRVCADELTASCEPHTAQLPDARRQLGTSHRQLADCLDKLMQACQSVPQGTTGAASSEQQEQQRLKFINSASGAKGRLNAAEQLLKEPLVCQLMKEDAGAALQRRLGARVAQLNAAVAALTAATADREHPDYAAADQAIQQIAQLMPQVVQARSIVVLSAESRTLCGTKSDAEQAAMLQELRALCEATQELCEHAGQAQGVSDAAAKFSAASGKLVYVVSPKAQDAHEKQVMALAATSCGKASELLSQVQQLTERVADAGAAAALDRCGASAADAAQALLTVAQMTAPTISDPQCQKQLISAAQKLRVCADELTASCEPHTAQLPDARRQLGTSHRQLAHCLDKLMQACQSASDGKNPDYPAAERAVTTVIELMPEIVQGNLGHAKTSKTAEEEKLAFKQFLDMIENAERGLNSAEEGLQVVSIITDYKRKNYTKQRNRRSLVRTLPALEVVRREQHMEDTLAKAGIEVAALVSANYADKLDYKAAMQPTISLTESVRSVVNDGSAICTTMSDEARKKFLEDMIGLCQSTKILCDTAKSEKEKLNDAAIVFGDQSVKLLRVVSSNVDPALEKEVCSSSIIKLLFVYHPISVTHYPSSITHHPSSIIHHPSSIIHHPSSIIHHPSSIIHHPSSIIHHPSSIIHHPSSIIHHPSSIIHHQSSIIHHPSSIIHHPSSIIHHP